MSFMYAVRNGYIIKVEDATVNIGDRSVQYSFSVYEGLRIVKKRAVFLSDHIDRLNESAAGIGLENPFSKEQITDWVYKLIEVNSIENATARVLLIGGAEPRLFITASTILSYPDTHYTEGVKAFSYHGERLFPTLKTSNLLMSYLALEDAKKKGGFESVLVDRDGCVTEGTRSNFYAIKGNVLYTAPNEKVLDGITRKRVVKAARELGMTVEYTAPKLDDVVSGVYDLAFISATSMAAMPLSSVDGYVFRGDRNIVIRMKDMIRKWEMDD